MMQLLAYSVYYLAWLIIGCDKDKNQNQINKKVTDFCAGGNHRRKRAT